MPLITKSEVISRCITNANFDTHLIKDTFIEIAELNHVKPFLGEDLYDACVAGGYVTLVNDYIQPMLIYYALVDYLPFSAFQVKNGGIFKHISENAESATKEEIDFLVQKYRDKAEWYTRRFIDYMSFNQSLFPEYYSNTNNDIYPDKDATFQGWVL